MADTLNPKHEAVLRKAAAAIRARGHEGDARLANSVEGIVASLARRASSAAAVPVDALPPLPEALKSVDVWVADTTKRNGTLENKTVEPDGDYYTAEKVREAQRAAVEADRAQRPENTQQQEGRDSALRAEPAGQQGARDAMLSALRKAVVALAHASGNPIYMEAYEAVSNAIEAEVDTRCRAEGGDGAPEAGDVSADRAQQGEPVVYARQWDLDNPDSIGRGIIVGHEAEGDWNVPLYRAATKAAAPDTYMCEVRVAGKGYNIPMASGADAPTRDIRDVKGNLVAIARPSCKPQGAAPVPDTGIPTAKLVQLTGAELRDPEYMRSYVEELQATIGQLASRRAPVSGTPTSVGPSEAKAGEDA